MNKLEKKIEMITQSVNIVPLQDPDTQNQSLFVGGTGQSRRKSGLVLIKW